MRGKIPAFIIAVILLLSVLLAGQFVFQAKTAYAAEEIAADRATFQAKLTTALTITKPTSYTLVFTGGNDAAALNVSGMLQNILSDEYLYYSMKGYSYASTVKTGSISVKFTFSFWETAAQKAAVDTKVASILAEIITPGMNDFAKEKAIHDWIITHVAYDTSLVQHSAYAGLFDSFKTVCQGYALLAYKMLTDPSVKIPAHIIEGKVHGIGHTWILAQIGGQWYHLDPTWDDPVPDVINRKVYAYYNLTDAQIAVDHIWSKTSPMTYPTAITEFAATLTSQETADPSNLTFYQDLEESLDFKYLLSANTLSNKADLTVYLQAANAAKQTNLNFRYVNASTFSADLKAVISSFSNIKGYSYTSESFTRTISPADALTHLTLISNVPVLVNGVTVSQATATLKVKGPTLKLSAAVLPDNASNKSLTWKSSDITIATVSALGVVTGVKAGTATISATASGGDNQIGTSIISVQQPVTGITINKKTMSVKVGATDTSLIARVAPETATVQEITYISSKPLVASVDLTTGVIKGLAPGVTTITAKSTDGNKVITATVTVPFNVEEVTLDKPEYFLALTKTASAISKVLPLKATIKTVNWGILDPNIATVSKTGVIKAGSTVGYTMLTATTVDEGKTVTAAVYTVVPVQKISFLSTSALVKIGETLPLTPIFTPSNATIQNVVFKSSKPDVATVTEGGVIQGVAIGTAIITATTREGKKLASFSVTVPTNVAGLLLNKSGEIQVNIGKPVSIIATIQPLKATNKKVNWSSDNESFAKVSNTGSVTGIAPGYATITAKADGDPTFLQSVTVAVYQPLQSVSFPKSSLVLQYHTSDNSIKAKYLKADATLSARAIVYSSSNTSIITVDSVTGEVYAAGGGTAKVIVTITAHDVIRTAFYTVTVPIPVLGITINKGSSATVEKTKTLALAAVFNPTNAANKLIVWTTSAEAIATVNSATGLVKAQSLTGSAVIRATSAFNNSIIAEITINVP